jgi:cyclase
MKYILSLVIGFLFSFHSFGQVNANYIDSLSTTMLDIKDELVTIKDNYYVIMPYGIAGNIGVYVGKEQIILIDDQWSILSSRIKEILKMITDKPVKYIVNTHFHYDHTNGNKAFGKENIPIIAHTNVRERLSKDQELSFGILQKALPLEALPSITFSDSLQLNDGVEIIELVHCKNAHTDGDVIVHFKKANIYHTGDIFVTYGLPFIDENDGGDIYGMIAAVDYLLSVSNAETKFIPGHGPVCSIIELSEYRKLLMSVKDQVAGFIKKGLPLEKIITEVKIDEKIKGESRKDFIPQVYRMVLKYEKKSSR